MPIRRLRNVAMLGTCVLVLITGCNQADEKPKPQPQAIATAKPGQVVSVMGDGTGLGGEEGAAAASPVSGPASLAEGRHGALLVGLQNTGEIIEISSRGQVRVVAYATSGVVRDALSAVALLADGRVATLEKLYRDGRTSVRLGRIGPEGKLVEWARVDVPGDTRRGNPGLSIAEGGTVIVVWDGLAWTLRGDKLVAGQVGVPGAMRAVVDGDGLLVASKDKIHRVRDGRATWSASVRPATGRGQGGLVSAIAPDGAGGVYVAMTDPAVVNHVTAQGTVALVASGVDARNCQSPVGGSALDYTPLKSPQALLVRDGQLLIADRECNRVFSVGVS